MKRTLTLLANFNQMNDKMKKGFITLSILGLIGCGCACDRAETPNSAAQSQTSSISEDVYSEEDSEGRTEEESSLNDGNIELPEDKFD